MVIACNCDSLPAAVTVFAHSAVAGADALCDEPPGESVGADSELDLHAKAANKISVV